VTNISILIFFKYAIFLSLSTTSYTLPLAISFYTFQQIAYLVDKYHQKIEQDRFREYLFFVLFFPQLVAGPIVHYNYLVPQIPRLAITKESFILGFSVFTIGLAKKILLADSLAPISDSAFAKVATHSIGSLDAIIGLLAYSFQIYFDFSGYSDMAIGLALVVGITLPTNFDSPYKARSIIHFWRRWHITLSDFLRDHIYIPLGGNRHGYTTQILALLATMVIGGIWHGSGWGFILWGAFHGLALAIVHTIRVSLPSVVAISVTFIYVSLLWVLFRSPSLDIALSYYDTILSLSLSEFKNIYIILSKGIYYNLFVDNRISMILLSAFIIFFSKNSTIYYTKIAPKYILFILGILLATTLKSISTTPSESFLYFNF
jgi:D-alanyl-lipoteichoic acid acyltransferase DltB (MBOAT superfamily)